MPMLQHVKARIRSKRENLAFKYMPRIADWIMRRVAMSAREQFGNESQSVGVLIDSCVRTHAVTHEEAWIDTGTVLWGGVHPINTGYIARVPVHAADKGLSVILCAGSYRWNGKDHRYGNRQGVTGSVAGRA